MMSKTFQQQLGTNHGFMVFLAVLMLVMSQFALIPISGVAGGHTAHAESATNSQQAQQQQPRAIAPTGTITGTYSYFVPTVANGSATGDTSYLTIQNTGSVGASGAAGTQSASVTISYYDGSGNKLNVPAANTLSPFAEWQPANPFSQGQADGSAEIDSNQPLVVIVSMITPRGSGTYVVPVAGSAYGGSDLPVFSNGASGITTRYNFYNPQSYPLTAYFYVLSQYGKVNNNGGAYNQQFEYKFTIPAHQSYIFDPSIDSTTNQVNSLGTPTPIAQGYYGYAHIGGLNGTVSGSPTVPIYLTTLMQEYRQSDHFSTFFDYNGLSNYESKQLYIPAVFKNAFGGFYSGMTFSPGSLTDGNIVINISFYDQTGKNVFNMASPNVYYSSQYSLYTGNISGLPDGFAGSAIATLTTADKAPAIDEVVVNEQGPAGNGFARSGVYMGLANDYLLTGYKLPFPYSAPYTNQVTSLPVMANGAYGGYYTGLTVQNLLNQPVSFTLTYQNPDGSTLSGTTTKTYTLQPYASQFIYQGSESLPVNWFGNAVVKVTTALPAPASNGSGPYYAVAVQTNVQSGFGFYTYSMPGNVIE